MSHILQVDASARPGFAGLDDHGSQSRNMTRQFVRQWQAKRASDTVIYRDIGQHPPSLTSHDWIASAYTPDDQRPPGCRTPWQKATN